MDRRRFLTTLLGLSLLLNGLFVATAATKITQGSGKDADPVEMAVAVTPDDNTDLTYTTRGLYIGGAGNVVVRMYNASGTAASVTFTGVSAGTVLPIRAQRVLSTSTTATNIVALW